MAEKDFRQDLVGGINEHIGGHVYVIPDHPGGFFHKQFGSLLGDKKPYDMFWLHAGVYHAMELKQCRKFALRVDLEKTSQPHLEAHQEACLLDVEKHGGRGWVVVNFLVEDLSKKSAREYGGEPGGLLNEAWAARITTLCDDRRTYGRTSMDLDWWRKQKPLTPTGEKQKLWVPRSLL